jgi:hypothetical protein
MKMYQLNSGKHGMSKKNIRMNIGKSFMVLMENF